MNDVDQEQMRVKTIISSTSHLITAQHTCALIHHLIDGQLTSSGLSRNDDGLVGMIVDKCFVGVISECVTVWR